MAESGATATPAQGRLTATLLTFKWIGWNPHCMGLSKSLPARSSAFACLAGVALALSDNVYAEAATKFRPNILFVNADDMGLAITP